MEKMLKCVFVIIDTDWHKVSMYEYIGYFFNRQEIKQFIQDNEKVGNKVRLKYTRKVNRADVPSDHF
jgi:hypothetical protein